MSLIYTFQSSFFSKQMRCKECKERFLKMHAKIMQSLNFSLGTPLFFSCNYTTFSLGPPSMFSSILTTSSWNSTMLSSIPTTSSWNSTRIFLLELPYVHRLHKKCGAVRAVSFLLKKNVRLEIMPRLQ